MSSVADFLKENAAPTHPGIKFATIGQSFIGIVQGDARTALTDDLPVPGKPLTQSEKMIVNVIISTDPQHAQYQTACYVGKDAAGKDVDIPIVIGETYSLWLRPRTSGLRAVVEAVAKFHADLTPPVILKVEQCVPVDGSTLVMSYVADGEVKQRGFNPPKLMQAQYKAPAAQPSIVALASMI